jgi:FKBP-type peptidyl-prolyl cis-trans isomerase 2
MAQVKQGDTVQVHYKGKLDDGTVFDSSHGRGPLEFTVGRGHVIAGFQDAVVGMDVGESKTVHIPADEAYGPRDESIVLSMSCEKMPEDMDLETGDRLQVRRKDGTMVNVTVTDISESSVTLDGNHPLAGQALVFDIELLGIL